MLSRARRRTGAALCAAALAVTALTGAASVAAADDHGRGHDSRDRPGATEFWTPPANKDAVRQIARLRSQYRTEDAALVKAMVSTPQAVWFDGGTTPAQTARAVRQVLARAAAEREVPVLVAYNLPFRDCSQYSAGGATTVAEYEAWIDGFAAGLGRTRAVVVLEPDGLGIIPWYTTVNGVQEWCQPAEADPATAAADRFAMLNYAVDALGARPGASVYLDGTHTGWLGVGDAADRLLKAGVDRAAGFFLNVSNYRPTRELDKYASWLSRCIDLVQRASYPAASCPSQYYPADPADFTTWTRTDDAYTAAYTAAGLTFDPADAAHAVLDTSRNGRGPWTPPAGVYSDPQDWCNPPGRGLGPRPTTQTGNPVVDAWLWIKVPGESDGQCGRGLPGTDVVDPEWGQVDPAAGEWFGRQALQLARLAVPALDVDRRHHRAA